MQLNKRSNATARHGVARVLSKLGLCSRSEAARRVAEGRVRVNGRTVLDPEYPVRMGSDRVELDGAIGTPTDRIVIALNKPRGLLCTRSDERGRATVYQCLEGAGLPWLAPVGRLDQASEGLLLFSNDPVWSAAVLDPKRGPDKTYHVQVAGHLDEISMRRLIDGIEDAGEHLRARRAERLRRGEKNDWLEIVLDEGRNRQIRRMLAAVGHPVLRLLRVAIGPLQLGDLAKGQWRGLSEQEIAALTAGSAATLSPEP